MLLVIFTFRNKTVCVKFLMFSNTELWVVLCAVLRPWVCLVEVELIITKMCWLHFRGKEVARVRSAWTGSNRRKYESTWRRKRDQTTMETPHLMHQCQEISVLQTVMMSYSLLFCRVWIVHSSKCKSFSLNKSIVHGNSKNSGTENAFSNPVTLRSHLMQLPSKYFPSATECSSSIHTFV